MGFFFALWLRCEGKVDLHTCSGYSRIIQWEFGICSGRFNKSSGGIRLLNNENFSWKNPSEIGGLNEEIKVQKCLMFCLKSSPKVWPISIYFPDELGKWIFYSKIHRVLFLFCLLLTPTQRSPLVTSGFKPFSHVCVRISSQKVYGRTLLQDFTFMWGGRSSNPRFSGSTKIGFETKVWIFLVEKFLATLMVIYACSH